MQTQLHSSTQPNVRLSNKPRVLSILYPFLFLFLLLFMGWTSMTAFAQQPSPTVLYVDKDAAGAASGLSWSDAYTNVQAALAAAQSGVEIWVAEGVYYPDVGGGKGNNDRSASFIIPSGVKLYGGFAGGERGLNERDWRQHATVLSGDIDQNDRADAAGVVTNSSNISGANSFHVVYLNGATNPITDATRIDGFVVTAGRANGAQFPDDSGAGLFCNGFTNGECSPTLMNVTFSGNSANVNGGAMFNDGRNRGKSSPTLTNVIFSGNSAYSGGAIYNAAWDGGNASPVLTNVVFSGNSARSWAGGALFNQGERNGNSSPMLTNVTFSGNSAAMVGGAIYNYGGVQSATGASNPTLTNVILWKNSAPTAPSIYNQYGKPTIRYSIVENGLGSITGAITNSVIYDNSNMQSDPLFVQPVDPASAPTSAGDLRLQPTSPAIDAGDNRALPAGVRTDVDGNPRIVNGVVDMGAYELPALTLARPEEMNGLIANLEARLQPVVRYTGYDELAFSLTEAPENMTIDFSSGLIRWTPQEVNEGQSYTVSVAVNDGGRFAETSFLVTVLKPEPVTVVITGNVLTVDDPSTTLNGMTITQLEGESILAQLKLGKLDAEVAPARPAWVTLLSDVFVVRGSFDQDVELRFPLAALPANVARGDVDVYAFGEALDVDGQFWAPVWMRVEYEETTGAPIMVVELAGLEGMAAWGYDAAPEEGATGEFPVVAHRFGLAAPIPQQVVCKEQGQPQDKAHICTTGTVTVTIRGWGDSLTRWKGENVTTTVATKEMLVGWLLDAQKWFTDTHLGFDKSFNVAIEDMSNDPGTLGYVSGAEEYKTLHINSDNSLAAAKLQGTAIHEYFHHAQGHPNTQVAGRDLLINGGNATSWMSEGTARWVEDELYDSLNTYTLKEGGGYRIAEAGMNSDYGDGKGVKRPYQRFSFFKWLTRSCPNFVSRFRDGLNVDLQTDPSGVINLAALFGSAGFNCNFGNHLDAKNSASLAAALAYYNYATQFKNNISLLDANEPYTKTNPPFAFDGPRQNWTPSVDPQSQITLTAPTYIPPVGAVSFVVPAIASGLPAGKVAELVIEAGGEITVSITSADAGFSGTNTIGNDPHTWFSTTVQTSYRYGGDGAAPALFVTLVNASLKDTVQNVKVIRRINDKNLPQLTITSPQAGASVSQRVITVTGVISQAARVSTTRVTVVANGIAANTPMKPDGSFEVQVVAALGENQIRAQGFGSDSKPTTQEKTRTVQGVAAADSTKRNALIASRLVFVLRWDTDATDVDIYTTDKLSGTVWYGNLSQGPGVLDFDDRDGYGPEVTSYHATTDTVYVDGVFDVDVHYYAGSPPTNFTLDVILNETEPANRRIRQYRSAQPLVIANNSQNSPTGAGDSRFNNILRITCSPQRVCNLASVDSAHLTPSGAAATP